jgi:tRNA (cytidine/uridine-2'-O-)-methyltransferase
MVTRFTVTMVVQHKPKKLKPAGRRFFRSMKAIRAGLAPRRVCGPAGGTSRLETSHPVVGRTRLARVEVVLVAPEIPQNTGCAARLAAATGTRLHLVEPLGFSLDSKHLKRAGLDYWPEVDMTVHPDWSSLLGVLGEQGAAEPRLRLLTARGGGSLFDAPFRGDEVLVFGCESKGLSPALLREFVSQRLTVPILPEVRSLNLANVVCLSLYTALERCGRLPATAPG